MHLQILRNRDSARTGLFPFVGLLTCLLVAGCAAPAGSSDPTAENTTAEKGKDVIYQVSTLSSLVEGNFGGTEAVGPLMQRGSLGLGTVDQLDGEMIVVGGTAYAIRDDGSVDELDGGTTLPFGVVTPFEVDTTLTLRNVGSFAELQSRLDEKLPSTGQLYAFRITGAFEYLETRSVSAQQPPYPPLQEVIANQTPFTFDDVAGTMVGFRIPDVFEGVNAVGHHAHFVTEERDGGGHVLDVRASELTVQIDRSSALRVEPCGSS